MLTVITETGRLSIEPKPDETLLAALVGSGVFVDAPCGGGGKCGKCRVFASGELSPVTEEEKRLLGEEELAKGIRLACCARATGDAVVQTRRQEGLSIETDGFGGSLDFSPAVRRYVPTVPAADLRRQTDDAARIAEALAGEGVAVTEVSLTACRNAPAALRKEGGKIGAVVYRGRLLDVTAADAPVCGMAVDIGTTTVVAYFYDLLDGRRLTVKSALNPQRAYGADVISRISACEEPNGLSDQQAAIVGLLGGMAAEFGQETGIPASSIYHVAIAANTTMLHLLSSITPKNIANAPFISATLFGFDLPAFSLRLPVCPDAPVSLLPCVSSYVGADISAGLLHCGLDDSDERVIYLDIGTNGEMAYCGGRDKRLICCSTAAGPAFEGAHIRCGTGGVRGAVRGMTLAGDSFALDTIGGAEPVGICGSGLIDAVAVLLRIGAIDETGRLADEDELDSPFDSHIDDEGNFVLHQASGLMLTQQDIREVQLAKSAVCAGIYTLLHTAGVSVEQIDRVVIAGGFGAHIRPESACAIGLLPPDTLDKIEMVGNAAGMGAIRALLCADTCERLRRMIGNCDYLELSGSAVFQDHYIEEMMFNPS